MLDQLVIGSDLRDFELIIAWVGGLINDLKAFDMPMTTAVNELTNSRGRYDLNYLFIATTSQ